MVLRFLRGGHLEVAPVVMWFRRDLRVADNRALARAASIAGEDGVAAIFAFSAQLMAKSSPQRVSYLLQALRSLNLTMADRLNFSYGEPARDVADFASSLEASVVVATREFSPLGRQRDLRAKALLAERGIALELGDSPYLIPPGKLLASSGDCYRVFTPFYKAVLAQGFGEPRVAPGVEFAPRSRFDALAQEALLAPLRFDVSQFPASEEAARHRLVEFLSASAASYRVDRNDPSLEGTSRLSPALRFGVIHPREIAVAAGDFPGGDELLRQLVWRDFFAHVASSAPRGVWENFDARYDLLEFDDPSTAQVRDRLDAWKEGATGYPIVDAGMRQLRNTGWMHNRVRMITASFLVKDLHIHWRIGAKFFLEHLLDGDVASNNFSWQWVAGSGTDAAPYFRVFNPVLQSKRFDSTGNYIRRFVPELAHLSNRFIHEPWEAPSQGVLAATSYPERVVRHDLEREEALRRYAQMKEAVAGSAS